MGLGRFMGFGLDLWIMGLWIYGIGFGLDWIDGFHRYLLLTMGRYCIGYEIFHQLIT